MRTEHSVSNVYEDRFDLLGMSHLQDPFPVLAKLRDESPVHWSDKYKFWLMSRAREVRTILQSPELFSSETGSLMVARTQHLPASARRHFEIGSRFFSATCRQWMARITSGSVAPS
jgi:cytochrome P450